MNHPAPKSSIREKNASQFRFQDLERWQESMDIGDSLFDIANALERKGLFRFAEQLRGAGMSMSNNIAEGSGIFSKIEFRNYLTKETVRKATFIVIARLDRAIQNTLKILDSRLRGNDGTWSLTYGLLSNMARRSTFENANILILLKRRELIGEPILRELLPRLDLLFRNEFPKGPLKMRPLLSLFCLASCPVRHALFRLFAFPLVRFSASSRSRFNASLLPEFAS